jgi:predicted alpha-1,2-mannosidase
MRNSPRSALAALALVAPVALLAAADGDDPARWVDPFIGTDGHGHTYPGASLPFGMVQLSPDTRLSGWDGCSGYHYSDDVVYGFSHTHLSGTGVSDYGDILLMPVTGEPRVSNGAELGPDAGYASRFRKSSERAEPGWYAVHLADYGVDVELTATDRTGLHRYVFPEGVPSHVVVDLAHRDEVIESGLRIVGDREIVGHRRSSAWATDQVVYFVARLSRPFEKAVIHVDLEPTEAREAAGRDLRAVLSFGNSGGPLLVQVGVSAVDLDGARRNLEREHAGWNFGAAKSSARARWNDALGRVAIHGGTAGQRTVFYTALYHSLLAPNLFSDVDGRYRGMDGEIHRAEGRRHYTVFSLWDTFRATHPLFTILEPERTREFVQTFLAQYEQGGRLPVWELAANETDCMIGYHSVSVIADAYGKGIRGFDADLALEAMVDSATRDHFGLDAYQRQGFIGATDEHESVSKTLEYAYDDWCIARMAEQLGRDDVARRMYERSEAWRHLYDEQTGFFRPRENQSWLTPFDPFRVDNNFTEANAWQYSMFVPHDVEGLIEAHGGDEAFVARLDDLFSTTTGTTGREQPDITGMIGQYAHGNEPSHHMAWLYHYAGRPDLSAERVRQILDELYSDEPDGLAGNEDCGQLSSWYVLGALGLYQVAPGTDEYLLTPPLFRRTTLTLESGAELTVRTRGRGEYVREVRLDGEPLQRSYLRHAELVAGGEVEILLSRRPGDEWGRSREHRPRSTGSPVHVIPAPFVARGEPVFREATEVALAARTPESEILFTTDRAQPVERWRLYDSPLELTDSTSIHFMARVGTRSSPIVRADFHEIPHRWQVKTLTEPLSQYTAGGELALIDGRRGPLEWRAGGWQGYQGVDFEALVDLGEIRLVRGAGAGFLQDVRSWIWMPSGLVVEISTDGVSFERAAELEGEPPRDDDEVEVRVWMARFDPVEARWLRVRAKSAGPIPSWHPGHGEQTILFVDELFVELAGP